MWYFTWILGASLAVLLAVANTIVWEVRESVQNPGEQD